MKLRPLCTHGLVCSLLLSTAPPIPGAWEKQGWAWGGDLGAPEGGVQIKHLRWLRVLLTPRWSFGATVQA